jgi:hypothetical protein
MSAFDFILKYRYCLVWMVCIMVIHFQYIVLDTFKQC